MKKNLVANKTKKAAMAAELIEVVGTYSSTVNLDKDSLVQKSEEELQKALNFAYDEAAQYGLNL